MNNKNNIKSILKLNFFTAIYTKINNKASAFRYRYLYVLKII